MACRAGGNISHARSLTDRRRARAPAIRRGRSRPTRGFPVARASASSDPALFVRAGHRRRSGSGGRRTRGRRGARRPTSTRAAAAAGSRASIRASSRAMRRTRRPLEGGRPDHDLRAAPTSTVSSANASAARPEERERRRETDRGRQSRPGPAGGGPRSPRPQTGLPGGGEAGAAEEGRARRGAAASQASLRRWRRLPDERPDLDAQTGRERRDQDAARRLDSTGFGIV